MGYITTRGGTSRRIELPGLSETVTLELNDASAAVVTVSGDVTGDRPGSGAAASSDSGPADVVRSPSGWDWGTRAKSNGRTG